MAERIKFISAYLEGDDTFTDLCEQYGISRKTGYKWVERYREGSVDGLGDRSRAPLSHPHAVPQETVAKILEARQKHPSWGPRKLLVVLRRRWPHVELPVASTIGDILRRNGLVHVRRRRRRSVVYGEPLREYNAPNAVWCADYKGHFPVNGKRCHPLTITDGFSRYLLCCKGLARPLFADTRKVFESIFREFGLPAAIRTDNGAPFSTLAPAGLSRLAVWWIRLGIRPERIKPGRPDQNGRHERMHRTLKADTARPPRSSFSAQQRAFDAFRAEYNYERPHEALAQDVPASFYVASLRQYPKHLPEPQYPEHFHVQQAYPNGVISLAGIQWYISGCLGGEYIGLEEVAHGCWKAYFGPIPLGLLDVRHAIDHRNRSFAVLFPYDDRGNVARRRPYRP